MKMECHLSDVIELPLCPSNPQEKSNRENKEHCLCINVKDLSVWCHECQENANNENNIASHLNPCPKPLSI